MTEHSTTTRAKSLNALPLAFAYRKGTNDIAREFYLPCHAAANSYDRAVGFFSSSIYVIAWPSLRQFVDRGGRIRLICSPVLSGQDQEAMTEGHMALHEREFANKLRDEVRRLLANPNLSKPTRVLAALVAMGALSIRIAFVSGDSDSRSQRIFHDKLGIFRDIGGHVVVFKGSMNETWAGLSADGNLESVDVFVSWGGDREAVRVDDESRYFEDLWADRYPSVSVRDFPDVARQELVDSADLKKWPQILDEICNEIELAGELSPDRKPRGRVPRPHQVQALQAWNDWGRRGILEHATGSGKTFTALCAMRDSLGRGETPIVLVPSDLLVQQWLREVHGTFDEQGAEVLVCDGRMPGWRSLLGAWTRRGGDRRVIIASMATAATDDFLTRVREGDHLFLIADEVHSLGSARRQAIFQLNTGPRLGLSATPHRAGDAVGTQAILAYFHGIVPPPFTLRDAIAAGTLSPYIYTVHTVPLTVDEQRDWDELTDRIGQTYAQGADRLAVGAEFSDRIRYLLLARARITKRAAAKVPLAEQIVRNEYKRGQRWIVYCDSLGQLRAVTGRLRHAGLDAAEYHSGLPDPQRLATLTQFEALGGLIVAIKCLDEGVDIPSVDHALILASSKNPREFVQRRGRVLRAHQGKHFASIHDAIVIPNGPKDDDLGNRLLVGELARAIEFGRGALNPSCITDIELIANRFELNPADLSAVGIESDDDNTDTSANDDE